METEAPGLAQGAAPPRPEAPSCRLVGRQLETRLGITQRASGGGVPSLARSYYDYICSPPAVLMGARARGLGGARRRGPRCVFIVNAAYRVRAPRPRRAQERYRQGDRGRAAGTCGRRYCLCSVRVLTLGCGRAWSCAEVSEACGRPWEEVDRGEGEGGYKYVEGRDTGEDQRSLPQLHTALLFFLEPTSLCTFAMDAFFTIAAVVPAEETPVEVVLVDQETTGSGSSHSTCTIA